MWSLVTASHNCGIKLFHACIITLYNTCSAWFLDIRMYQLVVAVLLFAILGVLDM